MKIFECAICGQPSNFEDSCCESCGAALGYDPQTAQMLAVDQTDTRGFVSQEPSRSYRRCANAAFEACNWLARDDGHDTFCVACRHNRMVPDLSLTRNLIHWRQVEAAKRRLFYSLLRFGLPLATRADDPSGLAFEFLADSSEGHLVSSPVLTGHDNGLITLNIAEADDVERERRRSMFGEHYRTLLGHFRHEIGHYFWNVLVRDTGQAPAFRDIFGDERADYGRALQTYYAAGPPRDWRDHHVSAYATAHPWEDFAETWAHYLHIVDTLETASAFGVRVQPGLPSTVPPAVVDFDPYRMPDLNRLVEAWLPVTYALNALNRSMGQRDLYPFVLAPIVIAKLAFVHERIRSASGSDDDAQDADVLKAVIAGLRTRIATPKTSQ
jgi:hypothetical protein